MTLKICTLAGLGSICLLILSCSKPDAGPPELDEPSEFRATVVESQNVILDENGLVTDSSDALANVENGEDQAGVLEAGADEPVKKEVAGDPAAPAPGASPSPSPATPAPRASPVVKEPETNVEDDQLTCAQLLGVPAAQVKMLAFDAPLDLKDDEALAMKVSGSQRLIQFRLEKLAGEKALKGLCVLTAGRQNKVDLEIDAAVQRVAIVTRGNQSNVHLKVNASGSLNEIMIGGKKSTITIDGPGTFKCPAAPDAALEIALTCTPPPAVP